jgi:hypothetical protein
MGKIQIIMIIIIIIITTTTTIKNSEEELRVNAGDINNMRKLLTT